MANAKKLPSGSWRVNQYVGKRPDGTRHYESFTAETKKEAEYLAAEYMMNRAKKARPLSMTVGEAIDNYIEARSNVLSPSTIREYKASRRNQFQSLMGVRLESLTQDAIQRAVNVEATGHSPKYVRNAHGLLSAALAAYYPDFNLQTNLPQKVKREIVVPERDDVSRIMDTIKGTDMEIPVILAACLGMRRSEICALTGADIDRKKATLTINKAMVLDADHTWVIKNPKSYAGTRTIPVPCAVMARLKGIPATDERIISCSPNTVTHRFYHLTRRIGCKMRFHDLRHYNASVMQALGVPDKYAMERLGQSTPNMLKTVYQHVMRDKRTEVSDKVNSYMDGLMQHEMQHETEISQ